MSRLHASSRLRGREANVTAKVQSLFGNANYMISMDAKMLLQTLQERQSGELR